MRKTPFKFLDSYSKKDINIFFGRADETRKLYESLSGVKHLLVYGPSGAGKTSLIECGLRNEFSNADWFALTIRRGNNINASVYSSINKYLKSKIELEEKTGLPIDKNIHFETVAEQLFNERYKPVYLLFDQFEELFVSGSEDEQINFFTRLNQLIRYRVPCRVLLIMREEFIGYLSEFEKQCPTIFQHRFRLEKMRRDDVEQVIQQTLIAPRFVKDFEVKESDTLAKTILSKLPDQVRQIELTHVQVFLNELWERAIKETNDDALPILDQQLIHEDDNLQRILDSFLKKQLQEIAPIHGNQLPLEVLVCMISERHTKLQLTTSSIENALTDNEIQLSKPLIPLLQDLQDRKIIREFKQNEQTAFEITHDILALAVGQNLTEEMQLREKAKEVVKVYEERTDYFSSKDIEYLSRFEGYYQKDFQLYIDDSRLHQKNRRRRFAFMIALAFLSLVALTSWAFVQRNNAKTEALNAVKATKAAQTADSLARIERDRALLSDSLAKIQLARAVRSDSIAQKEKQNAQENLENIIAAQEAQEARVRAEIEQLLASVQAMREIGDTTMATEILNYARQQAKEYPKLLKIIQ